MNNDFPPDSRRLSAADQFCETPRSSSPVATHRSSKKEGETLDEIRLLGQPPLSHYLNVVRDFAVDGAAMDKATLVDSWRAANDHYHELEKKEAGIADEIEVLDLDPSLEALVEEAKSDPRYLYTFDSFPTRFGMVELDRLVVSQNHITQQFSDALQERLGPAPNPEKLFRFCLPSEDPAAPVEIRQVGGRRYIFSSESTDFRPHDPVLLRPDQVLDHSTFGPICGVVGLVVGFGSNFFTGIQYGDRVVLHNGYHRAHAMRALGISHAPCIIQTVTRRDELEVAASRRVADDPAFYFAAARPPLLKDFFDPGICVLLRVHKTVKMIEVTFEVRDFDVRA